MLAYVWRSYAQSFDGPLRRCTLSALGKVVTTPLHRYLPVNSSNQCRNIVLVDSGADSLTASTPEAHRSGRWRPTLPLRGKCISPSGLVGMVLPSTPTDDCALPVAIAVTVLPTSFRVLRRSMPAPARSFASCRRRRRLSYRRAVNDTVHIVQAQVYVCRAGIAFGSRARRLMHVTSSPLHNLRVVMRQGTRKKRAK